MTQFVKAEILGAPAPPRFFTPLAVVQPLAVAICTRTFPHKAMPRSESLFQPRFDDMISQFASIRGEWVCRSLSPMMSRLEELDEGGIWDGQVEAKVEALVNLWEVMLVVIEAETLVIVTLFQPPPPTLLLLAFVQPLKLLTNSLAPTLTTLRKSLSSHSILALALFQGLTRLQPRWDEVISKCLSMTHSSSRDFHAALSSPLSTLRQLCQRSFPEFLVDLRSTQSNDQSTAISNTTHSTLTYLENLPKYNDAVEGILGRSSSERGWLMGMREGPSPARSAAEEGGVLNFYVGAWR